MKEQFMQWAERIDALELRERALILITAVILLYLLMDMFALKPTYKAQQITQQAIAEQQTNLYSTYEQSSLLSDAALHDDPIKYRYAIRDRLTSEFAALNSSINKQLGVLVDPGQASEVLEHVLESKPGLKLLSMEASSHSLEEIDVNVLPDSAGLGQYQIELVLSGSYLDVLSYLKELDEMPWKFFWKLVDFQVSEYPQAETILNLYTLGINHG